MPLVASLRAAGHSVSALLTTRNADAFAHKTFEHVHVVERIPWPKHGYTRETWSRALPEACAQRYDVALIASEEPAAYVFARRAGIPDRRGFHNGLQKPLKSFWARRQLTTAIYRPAHPLHPRHEVDVMYDLGRSLYAEPRPSRDPQIFAELLVEGPVLRNNVPAVQVTRKWLSRRRDPDLVRHWFAQLSAAQPFEGFCSAEEGTLGELIGKPAGLRMRYFDTVKEWKMAIAAAPYVITPDTGAAHLAGMLAIDCTDIFESDQFELQAARWSPWCGRNVVRPFPADRDGTQNFAQLLLEDWRTR
ncbi:MAG: hypothetical protein JO024_07065 [Candidatus Eremiobacteraeota bacterium]|nr:hypothetical protein [Candidatus Eremiobacteraeota bacterium]